MHIRVLTCTFARTSRVIDFSFAPRSQVSCCKKWTINHFAIQNIGRICEYHRYRIDPYTSCEEQAAARVLKLTTNMHKHRPSLYCFGQSSPNNKGRLQSIPCCHRKGNSPSLCNRIRIKCYFVNQAFSSLGGGSECPYTPGVCSILQINQSAAHLSRDPS